MSLYTLDEEVENARRSLEFFTEKVVQYAECVTLWKKQLNEALAKQERRDARKPQRKPGRKER